MQSWNWPGISTAIATLLRKPSDFIPSLIVEDIRGIDWKSLKSKHGLTALVFDKDNVLTLPYEFKLYLPLNSSFQEAKNVFGAENIVLYSNSLFSCAEKFNGDIPVLRHDEAMRKPNGAKIILEHFSGKPPAQIGVVGDRLSTDVLLANQAGMCSIYCSSILSERGDNAPAVFIRRIEQFLLHSFLKLKNKSK